jgi:hypothetical protein
MFETGLALYDAMRLICVLLSIILITHTFDWCMAHIRASRTSDSSTFQLMWDERSSVRTVLIYGVAALLFPISWGLYFLPILGDYFLWLDLPKSNTLGLFVSVMSLTVAEIVLTIHLSKRKELMTSAIICAFLLAFIVAEWHLMGFAGI